VSSIKNNHFGMVNSDITQKTGFAINQNQEEKEPITGCNKGTEHRGT